MKPTLAFTLTILFCAFAHGAASSDPAYELTCRAKAKEIAAETYRSCVTEYKSAEIERLRKDYQEKLKALKDDYEKEIEQLGGKTKAKKTAESSLPAKEKRTAVASKKKPAAKAVVITEEPTIEVKTTASAPVISDESQMDLPEPIPVEQ